MSVQSGGLLDIYFVKPPSLKNRAKVRTFAKNHLKRVYFLSNQMKFYEKTVRVGDGLQIIGVMPEWRIFLLNNFVEGSFGQKKDAPDVLKFSEWQLKPVLCSDFCTAQGITCAGAWEYFNCFSRVTK
ncbi:MAG TPA: hypothetical protein PKL15_05705 [Saprospiraceae bacterium]|nr:hypothetical protein [Saprospiraceae bacterium]